MCKLIEGENARVCTGCNKLKSFEEFHKNKNSKYGVQPQCKVCRSLAARKGKDRKRKVWDEEAVIAEIDKCLNIKEFYDNASGAVSWIKRNDRWELLDPLRVGPKSCSDSAISEIINLRTKHPDLSCAKIAKLVGVSGWAVSKYLKLNGFSVKQKLTKPEISLICEKFDQFNVKDLAEEFNVRECTIYNILKKNEVPLMPFCERQRKYPLNEDFFDIINTQEKAYILGFFYADGCNHSGNNQISMGLQEKDGHILEEFTNLICPTRPLGYKKATYKNFGGEKYLCKPQYRFAISSKHMSDRLTELGCMPQKTHKLKFPASEQVPDHLIRHFIRGYFDGDGWLSKECEFISMDGNSDLIKPMQTYLMRNLGFNKTKLGCRNPDISPNILRMDYGGKNQVRAFCEFIYEGSNIHLHRKYQRFMNSLG